MTQETTSPRIPNGAGAAAALAAGAGTAVLGALTLLTDKSAASKAALILYKPTGALSGVTTASLLAWGISWIVLHMLWAKKEVAIHKIVAIAFLLLAVGLLLTFPPFLDAI